MPVLKVNTITNAKFGSTDIRAVYRGSTQVYRRPSPEPMSWLPINMELRKAADIWISPNQSAGDVCCWVVADSMRPYYMDDIVEMSYGGVPGIYTGGIPISEGPEMIVDGVSYKPITFHSNVLTPDPNSLPTAFNVRQRHTTIRGPSGCRHPKPLQPHATRPFLRPISYQVQSITNHKELDNG